MKLEDYHTREDLAFIEAISNIISKRNYNPKKALIYSKFIGGAKGMCFFLMEEGKEPIRLKLKEFINKKMISLRITPDKILSMLESFHFSMMKGFKLKDHKKLYYIMCNAHTDGKPIIGTVINGKTQLVKRISDILAILGEGDDQLN